MVMQTMQIVKCNAFPAIPVFSGHPGVTGLFNNSLHSVKTWYLLWKTSTKKSFPKMLLKETKDMALERSIYGMCS